MTLILSVYDKWCMIIANLLISQQDIYAVPSLMLQLADKRDVLSPSVSPLCQYLWTPSQTSISSFSHPCALVLPPPPFIPRSSCRGFIMHLWSCCGSQQEDWICRSSSPECQRISISNTDGGRKGCWETKKDKKKKGGGGGDEHPCPRWVPPAWNTATYGKWENAHTHLFSVVLRLFPSHLVHPWFSLPRCT